MEIAGSGTCVACGPPGALVHLVDELLCDSCFDERISIVMGMPRLPEPPTTSSSTGAG